MTIRYESKMKIQLVEWFGSMFFNWLYVFMNFIYFSMEIQNNKNAPRLRRLTGKIGNTRLPSIICNNAWLLYTRLPRYQNQLQHVKTNCRAPSLFYQKTTFCGHIEIWWVRHLRNLFYSTADFTPEDNSSQTKPLECRLDVTKAMIKLDAIPQHARTIGHFILENLP